MQIKLLCLLLLAFFSYSQSITFNPNWEETNPPVNLKRYDPDCCCHRHQHSISKRIIKTHSLPLFSHRKHCPCSHYIIAVDESGSMSPVWTAAQFLLDSWMTSIDVPPNIPSFYYTHNFVSLF